MDIKKDLHLYFDHTIELRNKCVSWLKDFLKQQENQSYSLIDNDLTILFYFDEEDTVPLLVTTIELDEDGDIHFIDEDNDNDVWDCDVSSNSIINLTDVLINEQE